MWWLLLAVSLATAGCYGYGKAWQLSGLHLHRYWEKPRQAHFCNVARKRVVSRNTDVILRGRICQRTLYKTKEDPSLCTLRGRACVRKA